MRYVSTDGSLLHRGILLGSAFAILVLISLPGCDRTHRSDTKGDASQAETATDHSKEESAEASKLAKPFHYRDRLDREVVFTRVPQRIISLSPETTELLFAIGMGGRIVGSTAYCDFPSEAKSIPRVGLGTVESISRELIVNAKPDLILCKWDSHVPLVATFERIGIPILAIGPDSIESLLEEAEKFGELLGDPQTAGQFVTNFRKRLTQLEKMVAQLPEESRVSAFYEVWDEPLMTVGNDSFIGRLMKLAKVKNIFDDVTTPYPRVSSEVVVQRNPDVILAPSSHDQKISIEKYANRPSWGSIKAVQNRRIYLLDGDRISRCGPRMLQALEEILQRVYPELGNAPELSGAPEIENALSSQPNSGKTEQAEGPMP